MKIINFPKKIISFLKEVIAELKRVDFPSKKEVLKNTLIVIGISISVAAFLGGLDLLFNTLLNKLIL